MPALTSAPSATRTLTIRNQKGLHARAAAKFVKTVDGFEVRVTVSRRETRVDGHSIMGLMMLGAALGSVITIDAEGPEAVAAVEALALLVETRFGEEV